MYGMKNGGVKKFAEKNEETVVAPPLILKAARI